MKRGDIFLVEIPSAHGYEQSGLRPAIILNEPVANIVIIIPCTSNLESLRFPFTILINPNKSNGLKIETVSLVFQLRAIDRKRLIKHIGHLDITKKNEIKKLLRKMFLS